MRRQNDGETSAGGNFSCDCVDCKKNRYVCKGIHPARMTPFLSTRLSPDPLANRSHDGIDDVIGTEIGAVDNDGVFGDD